jgi:SNF2 family DNA or RNA helicase
MNHYTLADYYRAAGIFVPAFAEHVVMNPKKIPFPHQVSGLKVLATYDRSLLLDDPGTGKTITAQAYALWLAAQGNRGVLVMPPVLLEQFQASLADSYRGYEQFIRCEILAGTPQKRDRLTTGWDQSDAGWPELVLMSPKMFVKYREELQARKFNFGIFDEATIIGIKTPSSQMHKAVKTFAGNSMRDSNGIVLMTGTPVETNVPDAYGLIAIVTPNRYGSQTTFEKFHCVFAEVAFLDNEGTERVRKQVVGYRNLELLHESLMLQGRRVKKSDVNKDLPPRLITEIPITLSRAHRDLYDKLVNERMLEIGDRVLDYTNASAMYQAMQRVLLTPERFTTDKIENAILEGLDTIVESLGGKKLIVYAWYQESVAMLEKRYAHLNPAVINGRTSEKQRSIQKMKFVEDPTCLMVIANPRSGGVGIDGWQDVCSHVAFVEVCPFVGTFQQAISRLHRTGQKADAVNVYILVAKATIAVKLRNDLIKKDAHQEAVVRDKRTILAALRGDGGLQGSLDEVDFEQEIENEKELVDIDQE